MTAPFEWVRGAAWLFPDGTLDIVPGFHDEWIAAHQDRAPGCSNVADVVTRLGWVSVVSYSRGYVEFMIRSKSDSGSVRLCVEHLGRNLGRWENALVMTMDEEGYAKLTPDDFSDGASPESKIRGIFSVD
ncbi:MAG TPA: hypothetical protein PLQ29_07705 [Spirochaetales bacterium]|nr:hypothetical protein [Spirochaetales bacterium]HPG86569.1 hypothetical protein [Spirochaetales bacterium]HPM73731.1 hypothetical protein [Spirochaetales bacterium]